MEKVEGQFIGEVVGVIVEALNGDQLAGVAASIARTSHTTSATMMPFFMAEEISSSEKFIGDLQEEESASTTT